MGAILRRSWRYTVRLPVRIGGHDTVVLPVRRSGRYTVAVPVRIGGHDTILLPEYRSVRYTVAVPLRIGVLCNNIMYCKYRKSINFAISAYLGLCDKEYISEYPLRNI